MRPNTRRTLVWNDAQLKIDWELEGEPIVSAKDQRGVRSAMPKCFD